LFAASVLARKLRPDLSTKHTFPNSASMTKQILEKPAELGHPQEEIAENRSMFSLIKRFDVQ